MNINTVTISTQEYNDLRDFKRRIEEGNKYVVTQYYEKWFDTAKTYVNYYTDDAIVKQLCSTNDGLMVKIRSLEGQVKDLKNHLEDFKNPANKPITIEDIKQMSYWEFRKWRKQ